jgi:hypothetical protein
MSRTTEARGRARVRATSALLLVLVYPVAFATPPDRWLDPFFGDWIGDGRFLGNTAKYNLSWQPALGGKYVRLSVRYDWTANGAGRAFEGEALYPVLAGAQARGDWFDSEGHRYATSAYRNGANEVVVHWGEGNVRGRSTYLLAGEHLTVSDDAWRDDAWRTFSSARLRRR